MPVQITKSGKQYHLLFNDEDYLPFLPQIFQEHEWHGRQNREQNATVKTKGERNRINS